MSFTGKDAQTAALAAGFSKSDATTAAAIALAESGGNEGATSPVNSNGTRDYGAWQINSSHTAILASGDKYNLADNARMAFAVYKAQGFNAWTTYKSGAYKAQLPDSNSPSVKDWLTNPIGAATESSANASGLGGLVETVRKGVSAYIAAEVALVLLVIGILILTKDTSASKNLRATAMTATKVGALIA